MKRKNQKISGNSKSGKKDLDASGPTSTDTAKNIKKEKKGANDNKRANDKKGKTYPSLKTFLKRNRKLLLIIGSILLLFFILFIAFGMQVKFILQEEMDLTLSPIEKSIYVKNDQQINLNFTIGVDNPSMCRNICTYELRDVSENITVMNETRYDLDSDTIVYGLPIDDRGKGQKVFNMKVTCNNIKQNLCTSSEKKYFKTSIITVNYDYDEEELELRKELYSNINQTRKSILQYDKNLLILKNYADYLDYADSSKPFSEEQELERLIEHYGTFDADFDNLYEDMVELYKNDSYEMLYETLNSSRYEDLLNVLSGQEKSLQFANATASDLAEGVALSSFTDEDERLIEEGLYLAYLYNNTDLESDLSSLIEEQDDIALRIERKDFGSVAMLRQHGIMLDAKKNTLFYRYEDLKRNAYDDFLIASDEIFIMHALMDIPYGDIYESIYDTRRLEAGLNYPYISVGSAIGGVLDVDDICERTKELTDLIDMSNNEALEYRNENYGMIGEELDEVIEIYSQNKESEMYIEMVDILEESDEIALDAEDVYFTAKDLEPIVDLNGYIVAHGYDNINTTDESGDDIVFDMSTVDDWNMMLQVDTGGLSGYPDLYCRFNSVIFNGLTNPINVDISGIDAVPYMDNDGISLPDETGIDLSGRYPLPEFENSVCCVFGECSECCTEDECQDNYPLIFLHGHALSKENTPERSHEAFALLQELFEEEGYVNAGHISSDSVFYDLPRNEWGRFDSPISVRLSYYLLGYHDLGDYKVVTRKSDNIENYAIRLNEYIELVKYRTGKDKVDIVAHSMGGLVAREYMRIFGDGSVDKLIAIGTPNNGIEGRVKNLCSLTGASRECQDMHDDSIFISRLNNPSNQPDDAEIYTIRAEGCRMDGGPGDGIVLAESVKIPYATNYAINGTCTDLLKSDLHTRMLNPNAYPETFEIMKDILIEG